MADSWSNEVQARLPGRNFYEEQIGLVTLPPYNTGVKRFLVVTYSYI